MHQWLGTESLMACVQDRLECLSWVVVMQEIMAAPSYYLCYQHTVQSACGGEERVDSHAGRCSGQASVPASYGVPPDCWEAVC